MHGSRSGTAWRGIFRAQQGKRPRKQLTRHRTSGDSCPTRQTAWPRMGSHRQQTQAKSARERTVRERRARKLEKKRLAAEERKERSSSTAPRLPHDEPAVRFLT